MPRFFAQPPYPLLAVVTMVATVVLAGCQPQAPQVRAPGLALEQRTDGLVYELGGERGFTGVYRKKNPLGALVAEQHYVDGYKHGPYLQYYKTGSLWRRLDYLWGEVVRDRRWFAEGQISHDKKMHLGDAFGLSRYWFPNGQVRKLITLGPGVLAHGHVLEFDEHGRVLDDQIYEKGIFMAGTPVRPEATTPIGKEAPKSAVE